METQRIEFDPAKARELYRAYRKHQHYSTLIDWEIQRIYQLVAQGRVVIRAIESIKAAGLNEQRLPKLAIARADAEACFFRVERNECIFDTEAWPRRRVRHHSLEIRFSARDWPNVTTKWRSRATLPPIPLHLRPLRGLANYHVLWEAEWTPVPPRDPMLLRRIGRSDAWLVVAAWDLTEVERAVLATRMNG